MSEPKAPETEKGQAAREDYLNLAKSVLKQKALAYADLYQRYAGDLSAAQQLDQRIALVALQSGKSARMVIQLLAQGPYTQQQIQALTPDDKKAALPGLLHYAKTTVEAMQQQRYLTYANAVLGKARTYPDLYQAHISSDLSAIQLDQKVAAAALASGESAEGVVALLQQGPYARFQQDVKQLSADVVTQYANGTVAQVQAIQSLQPGRSSDLQR